LFVVAILPAIAVYLLPFVLSSLTRPAAYSSGGLEMVFRENIVRYFAPFDHRGSISTYFIALPVYLLPWTLFVPSAVLDARRHWPDLPDAERWSIWASLLVFLFLTASGSRRAYYVLPVLPFVILFLAQRVTQRPDLLRVAAWTGAATWCALSLWFGILLPLGFGDSGQRDFTRSVYERAVALAPWNEWRVIQSGAPPSAGFYLGEWIQTAVEPAHVEERDRKGLRAFLDKHSHVIVLTRRRFLDDLGPLVPDAVRVEERSRLPRFLQTRHTRGRGLVALISMRPES
jgi:4-amino-4-deoxy-L-arabinose transferase-like glycosyltransferase